MKWTEEKVDKLKELAKDHTIKEIAIIMGSTPGAIRLKAKSTNIPLLRDNSYFWSEEENTKFIKLTKKYHYTKVAEMMNLTPECVLQRARKYNIELIKDRYTWTNEEMKLLKEQWGVSKIEDISKRLHKSVNGTCYMARRMNLGPMVDADKTILRVKDMSNILNIPQNTIRSWFEQGLNYNIRYVSDNQYFVYVTWEDFIKYLKENQNKWDANNVDDYMLGEEPEWLREKRRRDRINPIQRKKLWTVDEVIYAMALVDKGKNYEEIGNILKRSPIAVAKMMQASGHGLNPDCYWIEEDKIYLDENYPHKTAGEIALDLGKTEESVRGQIKQRGIQKTKKLIKKSC